MLKVKGSKGLLVREGRALTSPGSEVDLFVARGQCCGKNSETRDAMGVKYIVKLLESLVFAAGSGFVCTANLRELAVGNLTDVVEIRDNARGRLRIALDISYIKLNNKDDKRPQYSHATPGVFDASLGDAPVRRGTAGAGPRGRRRAFRRDAFRPAASHADGDEEPGFKRGGGLPRCRVRCNLCV